MNRLAATLLGGFRAVEIQASELRGPDKLLRFTASVRPS
jgi:hypothetical protein